MKLFSIHFFMLFVLFQTVCAQQFSFDNASMQPFVAVEPAKSTLSIVDAPYKDGNASLQWQWSAPTSLLVDQNITLRNFRDGVIFWVYNEVPTQQNLVGEFRDANQQVRYHFSFGLNFKGWRICRIGSRYMLGNKAVSANLKLYLKTPVNVNQGRLFIDRFSYSSDVSYQNAPDAQQPNNNEARYVNHWNSLWKWESELTHDIVLKQNLTPAERAQLQQIDSNLQARYALPGTTTAINNAKTLFANANIRKVGQFWVGMPMVVKPDKTANDFSFAELGTMMYGLAVDALFNNNQLSEQQFIQLWDFVIDQGFAYGSSMGNQHHYGYDTRQIFIATYLMKDKLIAHNRLAEVSSAIAYWSGLAESRKPFDGVREGVVDTWNTLLMPRLLAAMLLPNANENYRAVASLVRWVETAFAFTPGNLGGFKPDGTVFHHAGHYPAYAVGGFEGIGLFLSAMHGAQFNIDVEARRNLAKALLGMTQYTFFSDWSIGMSGRHPHQGAINSATVEAIGWLALYGDLHDATKSVDNALAAEYLRLESGNTPLKVHFQGVAVAPNPTGFYVFNHAAAGVHRLFNTMVTIKGYNSDVWGSEIYTNDNRFGRYQSYGAVEIFNEGVPVSRSNSRFKEAGWDWNRLPGTTTIQLPLALLESPVPGTLMARSKEDFAGASSLLGQYGVFGMKLWEDNMTNNVNFTPDFKARKSVFTFDKRIVCIGTNITNSNATYETQTNLFQQSINNNTERVALNGVFTEANGFLFDSGKNSNVNLISDLSGNYYRVASNNQLIVEGKVQNSMHNKTKAATTGNFITARITHDKAPQNAAYEYMIMLRPTPLEQRRWAAEAPYSVWQANADAHIVHDSISGVVAYVAFNNVQPAQGIVRSVSAETLVMLLQPDAHNLRMSVCDPSLRLPVKTNGSDNTILNSAITTKTIELQGLWALDTGANDKLAISYANGNTQLNVQCQYGLVVEFGLKHMPTSVSKKNAENVHVQRNGNIVLVNGPTQWVNVFNINGQKVKSKHFFSDQKTFVLQSNTLYLLDIQTHDGKVYREKLLL